MTAPFEPLEGRCRCGAIRFVAEGAPTSVGHCHCESCRRSTGQPCVTLAVFERTSFRFTQGEMKIHNSSPGVYRGFCAECGTPLSWQGEGPKRDPYIEIYVGTFDQPARLAPRTHIYYEERVPWYDTADRLPRYAKNDKNAEPARREPALLEDRDEKT